MLDRISTDPSGDERTAVGSGTRITVKRVLYVLAECRNREEIYKDSTQRCARAWRSGGELRRRSPRGDVFFIVFNGRVAEQCFRNSEL
jgi:hypothetical protein